MFWVQEAYGFPGILKLPPHFLHLRNKMSGLDEKGNYRYFSLKFQFQSGEGLTLFFFPLFVSLS